MIELIRVAKEYQATCQRKKESGEMCGNQELVMAPSSQVAKFKLFRDFGWRIDRSIMWCSECAKSLGLKPAYRTEADRRNEQAARRAAKEAARDESAYDREDDPRHIRVKSVVPGRPKPGTDEWYEYHKDLVGDALKRFGGEPEEEVQSEAPEGEK